MQNYINQLNIQINSLSNENYNLKSNCNKIESNLKEEEQKKKEKENKLNAFKNTFKNDINEIKNKNIKESEKYILNFILNEFIRDIKVKKYANTLNNSLIKIMSAFINIFVSQSISFNNYFKSQTLKIIQNYKVNERNIKVEYINFIVMEPTGVGTSTFINESLLLEGNKRAEEGKGLPVTDKSNLYCSEKLEMLRMWDTIGVSYGIPQQQVLNEIRRLVDEGISKGIDNYINVIFYCNKDDRFQEEDAKLINKIMKIYPMDNLPVIITQSQAYFQEDSNEMKKIIRKIFKS